MEEFVTLFETKFEGKYTKVLMSMPVRREGSRHFRLSRCSEAPPILDYQARPHVDGASSMLDANKAQEYHISAVPALGGCIL